MTMSTVDRVVALQRVPLFAGVPGRTLAAVARCATELEAAAYICLSESMGKNEQEKDAERYFVHG